MAKKTIRLSKGYFSISAVAKMFSVHQQTIRLYEKQGLISPKRSEGNTRLFSEKDIDRLEEIMHLTHQLGVNLAGVEMILKLQNQIKKLQKEMNGVFDRTRQELEKESTSKNLNIRNNASKLMHLKRESTAEMSESAKLLPSTSDDSWEIEYDE